MIGVPSATALAATAVAGVKIMSRLPIMGPASLRLCMTRKYPRIAPKTVVPENAAQPTASSAGAAAQGRAKGSRMMPPRSMPTALTGSDPWRSSAQSGSELCRNARTLSSRHQARPVMPTTSEEGSPLVAMHQTPASASASPAASAGLGRRRERRQVKAIMYTRLSWPTSDSVAALVVSMATT